MQICLCMVHICHPICCVTLIDLQGTWAPDQQAKEVCSFQGIAFCEHEFFKYFISSHSIYITRSIVLFLRNSLFIHCEKHDILPKSHVKIQPGSKSMCYLQGLPFPFFWMILTCCGQAGCTTWDLCFHGVLCCNICQMDRSIWTFCYHDQGFTADMTSYRVHRT